MKCFLPTGGIDKMDLCMVGIKVHLYPHLIFYFGYFNALRNVLYMKSLAISQLTIFIKSVIIYKRSLVIVILSKKTDQIINKTYNIR